MKKRLNAGSNSSGIQPFEGLFGKREPLTGRERMQTVHGLLHVRKLFLPGTMAGVKFGWEGI